MTAQVTGLIHARPAHAANLLNKSFEEGRRVTTPGAVRATTSRRRRTTLVSLSRHHVAPQHDVDGRTGPRIAGFNTFLATASPWSLLTRALLTPTIILNLK